MRPNASARDDFYAYQSSHTSPTRPPSLPRVSAAAPIVHNYYVQDDRMPVPPPLFLTPNISVESLALSQPLPPTHGRGGMGEESYQELTPSTQEQQQHQKQQQQQRQRSKRDRTGHSTHNSGALVDPYAADHQGPVRPVSIEEERAHLNASIESHRRSKLPRKEPLYDHLPYNTNTNTHNNNNYPSSLHNAHAIQTNTAELQQLRSQYESLHTLVTETRAELRRSREENERARSAADRAVEELRAAVAHLTAHVELHADRHAALSGALSGAPALLNVCRADITTLQRDAKQTAAALAVLQSTVADLKAQQSTATTTGTGMGITTGTTTRGGGGGGDASVGILLTAPAGSTVGSNTTTVVSGGSGSGTGTGGFGFNKMIKPAAESATTATTSSSSSAFPTTIENKPPAVPAGTTGAMGGFSFGTTPTTTTASVAQTPVVAPEVISTNTASTNPFSASQQSIAPVNSTNTPATNMTFAMNTSIGGSNPFAASQTNGDPSSSSSSFSNPFGVPAKTNPPAPTEQMNFAKPLETVPAFEPSSTKNVSLGTRSKRTKIHY
ncbi:hypothetical protein LSM04_006261 [Trypanosoma melophagium]|uniref:uncharacterized protein n=1 Tax=Trypanosoma melophagium TaxID=715481 RepID=UPI00351A30CC|nr:hypothetical protein LSM04_006261 [Trypanosoma melophagium]